MNRSPPRLSRVALHGVVVRGLCLALALGLAACAQEQPGPEDSGLTVDGGAPDGGAPDAGAPDAGSPDAGLVTHGKDIHASNTGVPPGTALEAVSGTVTLSTPGEVWEGKDLQGTVIVTADDVILRNCRIDSDGYFAIQSQGAHRLLVERCEIFSSEGAYTGIVGDDLTVRRCDLHHFENGLIAGDNDLFEENFIHDLYYGPGAHVDGVEWGGSGSHSTVRRNRIELGGDTGCVNITPYGGGIAQDNTVADNLFSGGTYSLYIRGDGGGTVDGVTVTGNIWIKDSYAYGPVSVDSATGIVWSNNTLDDGTVVTP